MNYTKAFFMSCSSHFLFSSGCSVYPQDAHLVGEHLKDIPLNSRNLDIGMHASKECVVPPKILYISVSLFIRFKSLKVIALVESIPDFFLDNSYRKYAI